MKLFFMCLDRIHNSRLLLLKQDMSWILKGHIIFLVELSNSIIFVSIWLNLTDLLYLKVSLEIFKFNIDTHRFRTQATVAELVKVAFTYFLTNYKVILEIFKVKYHTQLSLLDRSPVLIWSWVQTQLETIFSLLKLLDFRKYHSVYC